jgi:hypothetical protein
MGEWRALLTRLEQSLAPWPLVLLPLIAGYVRAPRHEWDMSYWETEDRNPFTVSTTRVKGQRDGFHYQGGMSKYSLDGGPSSWGIDIEFVPLRRDRFVASVVVRIVHSSFGLSRERWGFLGILVAQTPPDGVQMISAGGRCIGTSKGLANHRIYVSFDKVLTKLAFDYSKDGLASRRLASFDFGGNLDEFHPAIRIDNGDGCRVTLVQAE